MCFPRLLSAVVPAIIAMVVAPTARATFTIGAADLRTGQIGAAGCSCVANLNLYDVAYHGLPGQGLVLVQAFPIVKRSEDGSYVPDMDSEVYRTMMSLLRNGTDPTEILQVITDPALDGGFSNRTDVRTGQPFSFPSASTRQYGIVDVWGRRDGYTGDRIKDVWSAQGEDEVRNQVYTQEDVQGPQERGGGTAPPSSFAYSAQGNIVSYGLVSLLAEAFENADTSNADNGGGNNDNEGGGACDDLVDRLFRAVVAVDDANQRAGADPTAADDADFVGDVKCERTNGAPCHTIFLHVDNPDGTNVVHWVWDAQTNVGEAVGFVVPPELPKAELGEYVQANHPNITTANPYDYLRRQYAQWRADHPCRSDSPADGTAGADSATTNDSSSSASSPPFGPVAGRCLGCILSSALLLLRM